MKSFFNLENPLFRFFARIFDIVHINLLCLLCSIPIVTIGPAVTAMYYCMFKIVRKTDTSISQMFFHSFRENLKQGILLTLLFIAATLILILDIRVCQHMDKPFLEYVEDILYVVCFVLSCVASYTFPLLAQFGNTSKILMKYALLLSISKFGYTLCIVSLNAIPFVVFILLPEVFLSTFLLWVFGGFSAIAYINARMIVPIFNRFIPES